MKKVFVNATAAQIGGLHTIVDQFIKSIIHTKNSNDYYIFVSNDMYTKYATSNIKIIKVDKKGWVKRFLWDSIGIKKWAKENDIYPDKIISLQNTPVNFKNVSQIVYVHTPIPFVSYNWNLFKKNQRKMWFYKNIYPFFISLYMNKYCEIVVQANWLKASFTKKFPKIKGNNIHVIRPGVDRNELLKSFECVDKTEEDKKIFFFPSIDYIYKNHITLLKAIKILKEKDIKLNGKLKVIFTVEPESWLRMEANKLGINDCIEFAGQMKYGEVLSNYSKADVILFPSYIETFGLPLLEAALYGKKILCADEEYSREVLGNSYNGVKFITSTNNEEWARSINDVLESKDISYPFTKLSEKNNWKEFLSLI